MDTQYLFFMSDASRLIRVHHKTIRRWIGKGKIKYRLNDTNRRMGYLFSLSEINRKRIERGLESLTLEEVERITGQIIVVHSTY